MARSLPLKELRRLGRALPHRLRFTREGKLLFAVTLGIGFGAVNSGNNLLYLILGMLLSLIVVSGMLSEISLRGLRARRESIGSLVADEACLVPVTLENTKRRLLARSLEVSELMVPGVATQQRAGLVLSVAPGAQHTLCSRVRPERRGLLTSAGVRVATRYPFGFFEKSRFFPRPVTWEVFPPRRQIEAPAVQPLASGAETRAPRVGMGDEFHGLRDHRVGDDARTIAWKVSARRDDTVVRENERRTTRHIALIVLNARVADDADDADDEAIEEVITHAAALARAWHAEGLAVGLVTLDGVVAPSAGAGTLEHLLGALARLPIRVLRPGESCPAVAPLRSAAERVLVRSAAQVASGLSVDADRDVVVGNPPAEEVA
jgi:uncharacterized protein (DUF58 family)